MRVARLGDHIINDVGGGRVGGEHNSGRHAGVNPPMRGGYPNLLRWVDPVTVRSLDIVGVLRVVDGQTRPAVAPQADPRSVRRCCLRDDRARAPFTRSVLGCSAGMNQRTSRFVYGNTTHPERPRDLGSTTSQQPSRLPSVRVLRPGPMQETRLDHDN
jgi:hypothetical protein